MTETGTALHGADTALEEAEAAHGETGYGMYLRTWIYLLILTVLEVAVVLAGTPRLLLVPLLLIMTGLKAAYIFANFMHLRFERLALSVIAVSPIVFGVILFFGMFTDF